MFATLVSAAAFAPALMATATPEKSDAAFTDIVRAHQDEIARYCARFVGDVALASDLTQEVFLTAWKERKTYDERGVLRHYLLRIARHRCLAVAKKRSTRRRLLERWQLPERNSAGAPSEARNIDRALGRLRPEHRDLIILRYLEELELTEIALIAELKLGTVKSRLSRALAALRVELDDE